MSKKFHFISGLPRSGSTLLAGILKQNPRFHAAMSSPVAGLVNGMLEQTGAGSEFYTFFDEEKRKRMCKALFNAYYDDKAQPDIIFDTNRLWTARLHQLVELFRFREDRSWRASRHPPLQRLRRGTRQPNLARRMPSVLSP